MMIVGGAVLAIVILAFVFSGDKSSKTDQQSSQSTVQTTDAAPAAPASAPLAAPTPAPSLNVDPASVSAPPQITPQMQSAPPNTGLGLIPVTQASDSIKQMLQGMISNNESMISQGAQAIKQLPVPRKGDRLTARSYNDQGLEAFKREDFVNAANYFFQGVNADPADQEVVNNLGYALLESRKFKESAYVLFCALTLNPERASAWFNLGEVLAMQGKQDAAVASFLLAYKFSKNPQKARDLMIQQVNKETDRPVIDALTIVLNRI